MNRRDLLQYGLVAAAMTLTPETRAAQRDALAAARRSFELDEATLVDLQDAMKSGKYTSRRITELYLKRIEQIDKQGPALHSVIELNPDALAMADALDAERKEKGPRSPLHGIPLLLKDNIGTYDKMTTTAGSLALEGSIPPRDSYVAERLREAGAVLLGKANLSEWANFRSNKSISGWSARGGQCKCPYVLTENPSGSSSGSAVAVAANLCAAAIGTETDGSIISPSEMNSIVGMKPTVGLISRAMIVPISHRQDSAGPMTRTVRDAAILLGALTGVDPNDPVTESSRGKFYSDYTPFLNANGLKGARIGVAPDARENPRINAALDVMKNAGAVLIEPVELNPGETHEWEMLLYEFKTDIQAYLEGLGAASPVRSLEEIIEFNNRNKETEMPHFGQEILIESQEKEPLTSEGYQKLLRNYNEVKSEGLDEAFEKHQLDAIVGIGTSPAAFAGYPIITVPAGYRMGRPVGLTFTGKAFSEPTLLKLAYAYEQATRLRRLPLFFPKLDEDDLNKASDAIRSLQGRRSLTDEQRKSIDLDADSDADIADVRHLLKRALGL